MKRSTNRVHQVEIKLGLIATFLLTLASTTMAFPTWIGVYGEYQRHDGDNPGTYTILMNQDYYGLRADVGVSVDGGAWAIHKMTYYGNVGGNSVWKYAPANPYPENAVVEYYFHGWDDWGDHGWDSNGGDNYTFMAPTPRVVTRGPYLQLGTPTSMQIRWRTGVPRESIVRYGSSPGNLNAQAGTHTLATEHEVTITGLSPDTQVFYSIGTSTETFAGDDADHYFVTSPLAGTSRPTRTWVLGDAGTANSDQRAVRDAFYQYNGSTYVDLMVLLGDNAYQDGTDQEYQSALFDVYPETLRQSVSWSVFGNHEGHTSDALTGTGPYFDLFSFPKNGEAGGVPSGTEAYYSFDYANIHYIAIDTTHNDPSPGSAMMQWLEADLAATTQQWIFALGHHGPYTKGSHDSDVEHAHIDVRENVVPLLESHGVDLFLAGHSHSYERSYLLHGHHGSSWSFDEYMKVNGGDGRTDGDGAYNMEGEGVVHIVAGNAGKTSGGSLDHPAMFFSESELGSLVIDVDNGQVEVDFLGADGLLHDYFTLTKEPIPLEWVGNTYHWPPGNQVHSDDDIWVNVESWPRGAGDTGFITYTLPEENSDPRGWEWFTVPLAFAGVNGNNDWWHVNLGSFPEGTTLQYSVGVEDVNGDVVWDNNNFQGYEVQVEGFLSDYSALSIPGSFNGWDTSATPMYLTANYTWEVVLSFTQVNNLTFKFAADNSWGVNWGDADQSDSSMPILGVVESGAANISIAGSLNGTFRIEFNEQTKFYYIEQVNP